MRALLVLALLSGAAAAGAATTVERPAAVRVPGTRVDLPLPAGFALSEQFAGVVHAETGASVLVSEVSRPLSVMRGALTKERLSEGGLVVHESRKVELAPSEGRAATLVYASQVSQGIPYRKWLLVFGDEESTVSLIATVNAALEEGMAEVLVDCIRGVHWHPEVEIDPFEGLGFRLVVGEGLVVAERVASMLFLTKPGGPDAVAPGDPLFIVGTTARPDALDDLAAFARENVRGIEEVRDVAFESEEAIEVDGLRAFETVARGVDFQTGAPVVVYQALALDGDARVVLMQGIVGADQADHYVPQFRAVATSFARDR